jgi:hypothetical protein
MIVIKTDLTKIDGAKLLEKDGRTFLELTDANLYKGKNGALYLDQVLFDSPDSPYNDDYMVCQSVSKEDRMSGKKGAILGNGKILQTKTRSLRETPADRKADDDEIPF